ncbi:putative signal peptide protein [Puccinia sorghi]|uniref:Putative signal peptide protein n=1 Tax=Puccinia sorghi TaxID=27349 RepID=A0A0L6VAP8_9BASI|nr:putative signal peptide protein [Puccinia sorghi]
MLLSWSSYMDLCAIFGVSTFIGSHLIPPNGSHVDICYPLMVDLVIFDTPYVRKGKFGFFGRTGLIGIIQCFGYNPRPYLPHIYNFLSVSHCKKNLLNCLQLTCRKSNEAFALMHSDCSKTATHANRWSLDGSLVSMLHVNCRQLSNFFFQCHLFAKRMPHNLVNEELDLLEIFISLYNLQMVKVQVKPKVPTPPPTGLLKKLFLIKTTKSNRKAPTFVITLTVTIHTLLKGHYIPGVTVAELPEQAYSPNFVLIVARCGLGDQTDDLSDSLGRLNTHLSEDVTKAENRGYWLNKLHRVLREYARLYKFTKFGMPIVCLIVPRVHVDSVDVTYTVNSSSSSAAKIGSMEMTCILPAPHRSSGCLRVSHQQTQGLSLAPLWSSVYLCDSSEMCRVYCPSPAMSVIYLFISIGGYMRITLSARLCSSYASSSPSTHTMWEENITNGTEHYKKNHQSEGDSHSQALVDSERRHFSSRRLVRRIKTILKPYVAASSIILQASQRGSLEDKKLSLTCAFYYFLVKRHKYKLVAEC